MKTECPQVGMRWCSEGYCQSVCVGLVASSTEEMATRSSAYHAHGTADSDKYCCYSWFVCHDIKSAMHPLLAQARHRMINHLTSKERGLVYVCFRGVA